MRKNFGSKSWFYPLPVLILGTYNPDGTPKTDSAPVTHWQSALEHGEKIGLGTREYELVKV